MNPKLFIGDLAFLLFFVSQGIETHDSEASFLEILMPFVISMIIIWPLFYKIGFLKVDENPDSLAFSIFPSEITDVIRVANNNLTMPPKSTWFDPKPLDGLVVYEFN